MPQKVRSFPSKRLESVSPKLKVTSHSSMCMSKCVSLPGAYCTTKVWWSSKEDPPQSSPACRTPPMSPARSRASPKSRAPTGSRTWRRNALKVSRIPTSFRMSPYWFMLFGFRSGSPDLR